MIDMVELLLFISGRPAGYVIV